MPQLDLWVEVKDGQVVSSVQSLPAKIASISENTQVRISYGWYPVESVKPDSFDSKTEVWEESQFDIQEDKVVWTLVKRLKTPEELQKETDDRAALERNLRDKLLEICDWRVIKAAETGIPESQEWKDYRQALRDVTTQPGFPWEINWPKAPE